MFVSSLCACLSMNISLCTGVYETIINKTGNVCHITMKTFTPICTYSLQFCILVCCNIYFLVSHNLISFLICSVFLIKTFNNTKRYFDRLNKSENINSIMIIPQF